MSYESEMIEQLKMPSKKEVEKALLKSLFKYNGVIKEFGTGEDIVTEIANNFQLSDEQRNAFLETIYRKENRVKRSSLWHRLLFRAADSLANKKLVCRPTQTVKLTNRKEWMLTENGFDEALNLLNIPKAQREFLSTKSFEVQKIVNKIIDSTRPQNYNPINKEKKIVKITKEIALRARGFRQAVIEAYDFKCAFCGMKLNSPDSLRWEVEAAHIVPHCSKGKDDIWNGLALCSLHHWAFDVGWITLQNDFTIQVSSKIKSLSTEFGKIEEFDFLRIYSSKKSKIFLPERKEIYPHENALTWHRENKFYH